MIKISFFFRIVLLLYYLFLSVLWRFLHVLFIFIFAPTLSSQTTSSHPFNFYLKKKIQTLKTYFFPPNIIRSVAFCGSMFDIHGRIFWEKTVSPCRISYGDWVSRTLAMLQFDLDRDWIGFVFTLIIFVNSYVQLLAISWR